MIVDFWPTMSVRNYRSPIGQKRRPFKIGYLAIKTQFRENRIEAIRGFRQSCVAIIID